MGPNDVNSWLRQVILLIRESVREADIVGMLAPDRLAVVMPGTGDVAIEPVCDKMRQALADANREQYMEAPVLVEFYPTVFSPDMKHPDQMLETPNPAIRKLEV